MELNLTIDTSSTIIKPNPNPVKIKKIVRKSKSKSTSNTNTPSTNTTEQSQVKSNTTYLDNVLHDWIELAGTLIDGFISKQPMIYIQPLFYETVYHSVLSLMQFQLNNKYTEMDTNMFKNQINQSIHQAFDIYFKHIAPCRSYPDTFIRSTKTPIDKLRSVLSHLQTIPQPKQRTEEWYAFRYRYLTASNIWKAFGSQSTKNQLIYEKCQPYQVNVPSTPSNSSSGSGSGNGSGVNVNSPMHWGQKYEELSIQWYQAKYKTIVSEFGCVPHKDETLSFLAVSPDGINTDETNDLYGRMVEVKNVVSRKITGIPKLEYWVQTQLQMEVCDLNECDFLETRFIEYDDEEHFNMDTMQTTDTNTDTKDDEHEDDNMYHIEMNSYHLTKHNKPKGVFMMFLDEDKSPKYVYPKWNQFHSTEKMDEWSQQMMNQEPYCKWMWVKNIFWRLDQVSCVLILRNKYWFKHAKPILCELWNTILHEREHGYEHRRPQSTSSTQENMLNKSTKIQVRKRPSQSQNDMDTLSIRVDTSPKLKSITTTPKNNSNPTIITTSTSKQQDNIENVENEVDDFPIKRRCLINIKKTFIPQTNA
jgi:hypothetical protein